MITLIKLLLNLSDTFNISKRRKYAFLSNLLCIYFTIIQRGDKPLNKSDEERAQNTNHDFNYNFPKLFFALFIFLVFTIIIIKRSKFEYLCLQIHI